MSQGISGSIVWGARLRPHCVFIQVHIPSQGRSLTGTYRYVYTPSWYLKGAGQERVQGEAAAVLTSTVTMLVHGRSLKVLNSSPLTLFNGSITWACQASLTASTACEVHLQGSK